MILNNARLIDGTGRVWESASIQIEEGRIVAVDGSTAQPEPQVAPDTDQLDLAGKTVIPGLINCHVHSCSQADDLVRSFARIGINTYYFSVSFHKWDDVVNAARL